MSAELIIVDRVDSTNTAARQAFETLDDGTLYCALEQYAGRGRLGRRWSAVPGSSIAASAVFKTVQQPFHAGALLALAALEVIGRHLGDDRAFFKWPNDIYIGRKKLAGILSEGVFSGGKFTGAVSGIGINVNHTGAMLAELDNPATSLFYESGRTFEITALYRMLFTELQKLNTSYRQSPETIIGRWIQANRLTGRVIEVKKPDGTILKGCFSAIAPDGAMLLDIDGICHRFDCGDVRIIPETSLP